MRDGHIYTYGLFMLMYGGNQLNTVNYPSIKNNKKENASIH